ncbi:MAG: class II aldolase/adducin family protein [Halobacteriaceae archaeon]
MVQAHVLRAPAPVAQPAPRPAHPTLHRTPAVIPPCPQPPRIPEDTPTDTPPDSRDPPADDPPTDDLPSAPERTAVAEAGRELVAADLTTGRGGNVSVRTDDGRLAVSPSGMAYDAVTPADVPVLAPDGTVVAGDRDPSSETPMHRALYDARPDAGAVVHTHSPYATTFAVLDEPVPPAHYLVAFAGSHVPVAPYETYGTAALGEAAADTLGEQFDACLLRNHGVVALGEDLDAAFETAQMVEFAARVAYQASCIGDPVLLPEDEVGRVRERFRHHGQSGDG